MTIPEEAGKVATSATEVCLLTILLAACAAPHGSKAVNPACVVHCVVELLDATGNPKLDTLTATQGSSQTGGSKTTTTTTGP